LSTPDARQDYGEEKIIAIGLIGKSVCVVFYTRREETIRIIFDRKANEREKRRYYERVENQRIKKLENIKDTSSDYSFRNNAQIAYSENKKPVTLRLDRDVLE
jgi:hypothetical protein